MTQHAGPTLEDIKAAANARMFDVLAALGIREAPRGGYISICSPVRKDSNPSFTIWTKGGFLTWKDHASNESGDVIDLVAHLKGWSGTRTKGRAEALRFLADLTGLRSATPAQLAQDRAKSQQRALELKKKADEERARNEGRAFELWIKARPLAAAPLALRYLAARGLDLQALPKGPRGGSRMPAVLRYIDRARHVWEERGSPRDGEQSFWPAMIAGCVDYALAEPRIRAVHRTWLDHRSGAGKAPVKPQRKVWPSFAGLVIPIWKGADNLSVGEAIDNGIRETLVLCEGIETALTAALAAPQFRVWAFIALGNLPNVPLPACIDGVIIHRENEWDNPAAVRAFDRGRAALENKGRPLAVAPAIGPGDWNDDWRS